MQLRSSASTVCFLPTAVRRLLAPLVTRPVGPFVYGGHHSLAARSRRTEAFASYTGSWILRQQPLELSLAPVQLGPRNGASRKADATLG
jgi:hypothetical protein